MALLVAQFVAATPAYADGAGTASLTINSASRNAATGNFEWDVTATATGFDDASSACHAPGVYGFCSMALMVRQADGSWGAIQSIPSGDVVGASYSYHFVGSTSIGRINTFFLEVSANGTSPEAYHSPDVSISDVIPTASAGLEIDSTGRDDATGNFTYDVNVTAQSAFVTGGPCWYYYHPYSNCALEVQVKRLDGSITSIDNYNTSAAVGAINQRLAGSAETGGQVVAMRVELYGNPQINAPIDTPWQTISSDVAPTTSASLKINSVTRDIATGKFRYDVSVSAHLPFRTGGPCWYYYHPYGTCALEVQVKRLDGSRSWIDAYYTSAVTGTINQRLTGSIALDGQVVSMRVELYGNPEINAPIDTPWQTIADVKPSEVSAGSNPAENSCPCSAADPVNTYTGAFWETATDLQLPGVGPSLMVGRTYSSVNRAADGPFGYGWSAGYAAQVQTHTDGSVTVLQENGATVDFAPQADGSYAAPDRVQATLTQNSSGGWTFTRRAVETLSFDSNGLLAGVADKSGNDVSLSYSGAALSQISGSGGRAITLTSNGSGRVTSATDSAGRTTTYDYSSAGNLTGVTTADGAVTHYGYDGNHQLTSMTAPEGGVTTTVYDSSGRVTSQRDPLNRTTSFSYDGATTTTAAPDGTRTSELYSGGVVIARTADVDGAHPRTSTFDFDGANNLVGSTDARGKTSTMTYDARGNVLTKTDPLGHTVSFTYDALSDVTSTTDALGNTSTATYSSAGKQLTSTSRGGVEQSWSYNANGTVATWTDGRGKSTSYGYNTRGLPIAVTDPDGRTASTTYDAAGFVTSQTNGANKTTTYSRDPVGRELTATTPGQHTTTTTYDGDGNVLTVSDPRGKVTTNTYDDADQLTSTEDPLGDVTAYENDDTGRLSATTDPDGKETTRGYNAFGELTTVTDPNGHTTHYGYDKAGNRTSITLPSGAESTATYEDAGQLASSTDAEGKTTTFTRNANGQVTSTTDPLNRATTQTWTDDGQPAVRTLPDSSTTEQTYTAIGALETFTNADGLVTHYTYSDAGLPTSKTEPGGLETDYTYDGAGRLKTTTTPDGRVVTLSYDDDGNVVTSHSDKSGSTDVTFSYNANAQRTSMQDVTGTASYSYDAAGQLTSTTNGAGSTVGYDYTDRGQIASITYPGNKTVDYTYDDAGQMTSVTDWANHSTTFGWTANGQLHTSAIPNGVTQTTTYDDDGQTTDIAVAGSSALADYGYTWNAAGELTADSSTDQLGSGITHQYGYDTLGQLASVGDGGAGAPSTVTASPGGQLSQAVDGTAFTYNTKQQLTASVPASGPSASYTYDGNGSRVSSTVAAIGATPAGTTNYSYDPDGNLDSVQLAGGATIAYTSDGDGLRQSRTEGSAATSLVWDVTGDLPLLLDDGEYSYIYGPGITPIAQVDDSTGSIQYLHADLLGSTRLITNSAGSATGAYRYSAYGTIADHDGAASSVGYTGNWTDPDSTLVYLRARDYDPTTGQFLQVDPAVDATRQPYAYVSNNPLASTDPTGRDLNDAIYNFLTQGPGRGVASALTGFGDGASLGLSRAIREAILPGSSCNVSHDGFYAGGQILGAAATIAVPGGGIVQASGRTAEIGGVAASAARAGAAIERVAMPGGRSIEELSAAGQALDRNGLTVAGRALQKHGDRGGAFVASPGNLAARNAQGQRALDDILDSYTTVQYKRGEVWVRDPTGKGAKFEGTTGKLIGFLEP